MKNLVIVASLSLFFIVSKINAQISVLVNGKEISDGSEIKSSEVKNIKIKFLPTSKANTSNNGIATIKVINKDKNNSTTSVNYTLQASGATAAENLLNNNGKEFVLCTTDGSHADLMGSAGKLLDYWNNQCASSTNTSTMNITVRVLYKDKIGYEKYGDETDVVKPFNFKVNTQANTGYISLPEFKAKISQDIANKITFLSASRANASFVEDDIFYKPGNLFYFKDKTENVYTFAFCLTLETGTLGQDEKVKQVLNSFEEYLISNTQKSSGFSIGKFGMKTGGSNSTNWAEIMTNCRNDKAKGKKKDINTELIHENIKLGQLAGYKVNSQFTSDSESEGKFSYIYLFPHPIEKNKILVFYKLFPASFTQTEYQTKINTIEGLLNGLEFN